MPNLCDILNRSDERQNLKNGAVVIGLVVIFVCVIFVIDALQQSTGAISDRSFEQVFTSAGNE